MIKIRLTAKWGYYPKGSNVKVSEEISKHIIANKLGYVIEDDEQQQILEARERLRALEADEEE